MKTIEERADKYLMSQGLVRGACASQIDYGARCMYDGYLQGDADRKSIDDELLKRAHKGILDKAIKEKKKLIDKACEWWNKEMREVNYGTYNETIKAFRKAMEE